MTDADAETPLLVSDDSLTRRHNASTTTTTSSLLTAGLKSGNHLTTPTQMSTKHLTPNNETMMMQHQQYHRYFAMSRFFQTWILPHWKMKLFRFIFFLYPYLEGYHKGRHPYDGSVYSVTKILSQMFAYSLYPDLIFTFLSKCRAMESFLDKTPLSLYMESDLHAMHVSSGKWLFYATWIHVLLQLVSWGVGGKIEKLWEGTTGRTGITMVICLPLIALPMMMKYFKINIRYEIRKGLHYLFFAFAIALVSIF